MHCQHISSALCLIQCGACSGITSSQAFIKISLLEVSEQPASLEFKHGGESGTRRAVRRNKNISRLALDSISRLCSPVLCCPSRHPRPASGPASQPVTPRQPLGISQAKGTKGPSVRFYLDSRHTCHLSCKERFLSLQNRSDPPGAVGWK